VSDTDSLQCRAPRWSEGTQIGLSGGIDEPIAARIKTVSLHFRFSISLWHRVVVVLRDFAPLCLAIFLTQSFASFVKQGKHGLGSGFIARKSEMYALAKAPERDWDE